MITQERLKELLDYNELTGIFTWKVNRKGHNIKGTEAGYFSKSTGYLNIKIEGNLYLTHRLAWLYLYGEFPKSVDHRDLNKTNNRKDNLRLATYSQNRCNTKATIKNKLGVKGLALEDGGRYCRAYVGVVGHKRKSKIFIIANYSSFEAVKEEAVKWLHETRQKLHGEFCNHG